jgi:hypothetical protein
MKSEYIDEAGNCIWCRKPAKDHTPEQDRTCTEEAFWRDRDYE